jgi:hypothetical protein
MATLIAILIRLPLPPPLIVCANKRGGARATKTPIKPNRGGKIPLLGDRIVTKEPAASAPLCRWFRDRHTNEI